MRQDIGSAIALNLLFHIPLAWGVPLTALDALVVLWLQQRGFRANGVQLDESSQLSTVALLHGRYLLLRKGKANHHLVEIS